VVYIVSMCCVATYSIFPDQKKKASKKMFNDDDIILVERTLCQLPSVHVFRIPTLNRAGGHR
jgi:hypothetical protein